MRWSPRASTRPPRRRVGTPVTVQPSGCEWMRAPSGRRPSVTASMRSVSFTRSSARAGHPGLAAGVGAEERDERQLVDEIRHLVGSDLGRDELARLHLHRRDRLAAGAAPVEDRDASAHPLEHVEQPRAAWVDAEIVDREVAARDERSRNQQRRRGREVPRNDDLLEPQRTRGLDRHRRRGAAHAHARRLEHALRVVAGRDPLDDRRPSLRVEAGEEDRGLHLRARHLGLDLDPAQRAGAVGRRAARGRRSSRPPRPCGGADRRRAPSAAGSATRRPMSVNSPSCPARTPVSSRISVPALRQSTVPARRPRRPAPRTTSSSSATSSTSTPSDRTASTVACVSPERPKPCTCVSPSVSAPIRTARCEIDLSPGTTTCPTSETAGLIFNRWCVP